MDQQTTETHDQLINGLADVYLAELCEDDGFWDVVDTIAMDELGRPARDFGEDNALDEWSEQGDNDARYFALSSEIVAQVLARAIVKSRTFPLLRPS